MQRLWVFKELRVAQLRRRTGLLPVALEEVVAHSHALGEVVKVGLDAISAEDQDASVPV